MLQCLLEEQKGFLIKILNIRTSHTENKGFLKELITILLENSCVEIYSHVIRTYNCIQPLLSRNVCKKSVRVNFRNFHTVLCARHGVEITEIHSHSFWQKFRESNDFTNKITK